MRQVIFLILINFFSFRVSAQMVTVTNDRNNFLYLGLDNPITVIAENCSCKDVIVKTNNGNISGNGCILVYRGKEIGPTDIIVYKKSGTKLKEIGRSAFRLKRLPPPVFKIGPYGSSDYIQNSKVQKMVIANQQYVRAELEGFDFDVKYSIDSFTVKIFYKDSAKIKTFLNATNKIDQQLSNGFLVLQKDDIVIINKIFATGPDGLQLELAPLLLSIDR